MVTKKPTTKHITRSATVVTAIFIVILAVLTVLIFKTYTLTSECGEQTELQAQIEEMNEANEKLNTRVIKLEKEITDAVKDEYDLRQEKESLESTKISLEKQLRNTREELTRAMKTLQDIYSQSDAEFSAYVRQYSGNLVVISKSAPDVHECVFTLNGNRKMGGIYDLEMGQEVEFEKGKNFPDDINVMRVDIACVEGAYSLTFDLK
ncbi:hypothetical protein HN419_05300 [Candidatus Woesearchaeota archaeon]|jgi:cell division protein FtsB|nr:hypothetical protein [Candidatus Woesearchaeota archaeon]MBT3537712.1 hypothetical protein [Candidatus Woesearchaeota archaeon]MBT4697843.1 hypothetical protein [Candidatus Woesearchaeota archaeon]MBT4717497.1 hypothetical protein [Candidatus Woesearchaeota archaeon]MBT7105381.1 hypothetical protein [Candidatus Woesearchaeota archaeon]